MDAETARKIAFALLAVAALAGAAATIDSTVTGGSGGFGGSAGAPESSGNEPVVDLPQSSGTFEGKPICVPVLARPPVVVGLAALLLIGHYAVYRRTGTSTSVVATAVAVGLPAVALWGILTACQRDLSFEFPRLGFGGGFPIGGGTGGFGTGATGDGAIATPTLLFGLLLLVALAGAVVLLVLSTASGGGDDADGTADSTPDEPDPDVEGVGEVAGAAADRIEGDADVGNEVYRAWVEMTAHLDVARPESSTPGEFAAAAVGAGMDADDVGELTRLFEAVRYGDERVTDERAERAVTALRRIESAYAGEES
ncbi:DUF4129 domain-containing protein [Halobellus captivus]|uniref:DUF4129 domain-containing protein n=1 Tax=Halobellus captivus TaxID=2592614 RepID=UPI0011A8624D|nr:DUF4129 domain-containing protein [Halobellus captivus]